MASRRLSLVDGPLHGWHHGRRGTDQVTDAEPGVELRALPREKPDAGSQDADRASLDSLVEGDQTALASLYDRHADAMLAVAFRILRNRRDAEDLLHDVFLEAWRRSSSYDARRGSVRGWLLLRVRSRSIDRLRQLSTSRQHAMASAAHPEDTLVPRHAAPDRRADHVRANRALETLPDEQRIVMELAYFEGLTCREVALRCGIPIGTVKSRMSTAVAKLRRKLVEEEVR